MLEIILGGYCGIIWLIFIKLKLFPWNIQTQIGSAVGGVLLLAAITFTVNIITPGSEDVRVINFVAEVAWACTMTGDLEVIWTSRSTSLHYVFSQ